MSRIRETPRGRLDARPAVRPERIPAATRHAPMLAARLRTVLPPADVGDVLQETFLTAWKGAGSYRPKAKADGTSKAGAWLWGIARRQGALLLRRRGPATEALPRLLEFGVLESGAAPGVPVPDDPAQAVAACALAVTGYAMRNPRGIQ